MTIIINNFGLHFGNITDNHDGQHYFGLITFNTEKEKGSGILFSSGVMTLMRGFSCSSAQFEQ